MSKSRKSNRSRAEASRFNGSKSKGPITPEGKARSSQNSRTHGLTGKTAVLSNEDKLVFDAHLASYRQVFQPANQVEADLVYELSMIRWRQRRLWCTETALLDHAMDRMAPAIAQDYQHIDELTRTALAFDDLANHGLSLELIRRYDSSFRRLFDRAFANLLQLRPPSPANLRNEPETPAASPQEHPLAA